MPKGVDPTGKKTAARRLIVALATAHPDWYVDTIHEAVAAQFPDYKKDSVRSVLRQSGLPIVRPPKSEKTSYYVASPRRIKPKPQPQIRASVHSYHGRSRLSAGYTEL